MLYWRSLETKDWNRKSSAKCLLIHQVTSSSFEFSRVALCWSFETIQVSGTYVLASLSGSGVHVHFQIQSVVQSKLLNSWVLNILTVLNGNGGSVKMNRVWVNSDHSDPVRNISQWSSLRRVETYYELSMRHNSYGTFLEAGERRTQAAADVLCRRFECRLDESMRPEGGIIHKC